MLVQPVAVDRVERITIGIAGAGMKGRIQHGNYKILLRIIRMDRFKYQIDRIIAFILGLINLIQIYSFRDLG